ncbi:unnamed protein product [Amoebophrya sp. A120]|nr:unnamed protein product [Amoebophrya sp. A120]|eukprot:GSA120T00017750001.1
MQAPTLGPPGQVMLDKQALKSRMRRISENHVYQSNTDLANAAGGPQPNSGLAGLPTSGAASAPVTQQELLAQAQFSQPERPPVYSVMSPSIETLATGGGQNNLYNNPGTVETIPPGMIAPPMSAAEVQHQPVGVSAAGAGYTSFQPAAGIINMKAGGTTTMFHQGARQEEVQDTDEDYTDREPQEKLAQKLAHDEEGRSYFLYYDEQGNKRVFPTDPASHPGFRNSKPSAGNVSAAAEPPSPRIPEATLAEDWEDEILQQKHEDLVRRVDLLEGMVMKMVHQEEVLDEKVRAKRAREKQEQTEQQIKQGRTYDVYFNQVNDSRTGKTRYPYRGATDGKQVGEGNEDDGEVLGPMCEDFARQVVC